MKPQPRKGQTALDFLMTYGWALIIVAVVAGALIALGVFNVGSFVGSRSTGFTQLGMVAWNVDATGLLALKLQNNAGIDINVTNVVATYGTMAYSYDISNYSIPRGRASGIILVGAVPGLAPKMYYVLPLRITYSDKSGFNYTETGTISGTVSLGTLGQSVSINSPHSNSVLTSQAITISLTVSGSPDHTNISILDELGNTANWTSSGSAGSFVVHLSVPIDGVYSINATAYFTNGSIITSTVSNITVNTTTPFAPLSLSIASPANDSILASRTITINFTVGGTSLNHTDVSIIGAAAGQSAVDNYVWVANYGGNTVSKIDKATGSAIATIPVDQQPFGIAVDQDSVWVPNSGSNTVSKIDKAAGNVTANITVGTAPQAIAVDRDSAWVANAGSGTVSQINKTDNAVIANITVGLTPVAVAVDNDYVWVANQGSNSVSQIDKSTCSGGTCSVIATITGLNGPGGISVDSDSVWVASNYNPASVYRINKSNTNSVSTIQMPNHFLYGISVDSDSVWVDSYYNSLAYRINKTDESYTQMLESFNVPFGISIDHDSIWIANYGDSTVLRINKTTDSMIGAPISVGNNPYSIGDMTGYAYDMFFSSGGSGVVNSTSIATASPGAYSAILTIPSDGTYNITATAYNDTGGSVSAMASNVTVNISAQLGPQCGDPLDIPNHVYTLTGDVSSNDTCFTIEADNVTLDCAGRTITFSQVGSGSGVFVDGRNNVTITDCNIVEGNGNSGASAIALYSNSSRNRIIGNNITTISDNTHGIDAFSGSGNVITGNVIITPGSSAYSVYLEPGSTGNNVTDNSIVVSGDGSYGIYLQSDATGNILINNSITVSGADTAGILLSVNSDSNVLSGNRITGASDGIRLESCSDNNITNNNVSSNANYGIWIGSSSDNLIYNNLFDNTNNVLLWDSGYANDWNTTLDCGTTNIIGGGCTGGNFWAQPDGNGWSELPDYCNANSSGLCASPYQIDSGNIDDLPLTNLPPPVELSDCNNSMYSSGYYILTQNVSNESTCFAIYADHVALDCAGHTVNYAQAYNSSGGALIFGSHATVKNCRFVSTNSSLFGITGVYTASDGSTIMNNTVTIAGNGAGIQDYSGGNSIIGNTINISGNQSSGISAPSGCISNDVISSNTINAVATGNNYSLNGISGCTSDSVFSNNIIRMVGNSSGSTWSFATNFYSFGVANNNSFISNNVTTNGTNSMAVAFNSFNGTIVENNTVLTLLGGSGLISLTNSSNSVVRGNNATALGNGSMGISLSNGRNYSITNNRVNSSGNVSCIGGNTVNNTAIANNTVFAYGVTVGIGVNTVNNVTAAGNTVYLYSSNNGIGMSTGNNLSAIGNTVYMYGNSSTGINLNGPSAGTNANDSNVSYNTVYAYGGTSVTGISIGFRSNNVTAAFNNVTMSGAFTSTASTGRPTGIMVLGRLNNTVMGNKINITDSALRNRGIIVVGNGQAGSDPSGTLVSGNTVVSSANDSRGLVFSNCSDNNAMGNTVSVTNNYSYGVLLGGTAGGANRTSYTANNITVLSDNSYGLWVGYSSLNDTASGNRIAADGSTTYAIYSSMGSANNAFYDNIINGTVYVDTANTWNTTLDCGTTGILGGCVGGNYWALPNGSGFSQNCTTNGSANSSGFCTASYVINGSNIDELPLTPIALLDCGIISSPGSYVLTGDVHSNDSIGGNCFIVQADNVIIDCSGHTINFSNAYAGHAINVNGYNRVTVRNCNIVQGNDSLSGALGVFLNSSNANIIGNNITLNGNQSTGIGTFVAVSAETISGNIITVSGNNSQALNLGSCSGSAVHGNTLNSTGTFAPFLPEPALMLYLSQGNSVYDNIIGTAGNNTPGVWLHTSPGNTIYNNSITITGASGGIQVTFNSNDGNISGNTILMLGSQNGAIFVTNSSGSVYSLNTINISANRSIGMNIQSDSSNNRFEWNNITGVASGSNYALNGITINSNSIGSDNNTVAHNRISMTGNNSGVSSFGINIGSTARNTNIMGNTVTMTGNSGTGINVAGTAGFADGGIGSTVASGNTVSTNGTSSNGINMFNGNYLSVNTNNITVYVQGHGINLGGNAAGTAFNDSSITFNTILIYGGNSSNGVNLGTRANRVSISSNNITMSGAFTSTALTQRPSGINVGGQANVTVTGNTINLTDSALRNRGIVVASGGQAGSNPSGTVVFANTITSTANDSRGIAFSNCSDNNATGNTVLITNNYSVGISLGGSTGGANRTYYADNNITVIGDNGYGLWVNASSANNTVSGNRIAMNSSAYVIYSLTGSNNLFYNNLFNGTANSDTNANIWNVTLSCSGPQNIIGGDCIGGNYWANATGDGWSQTCTDTTPADGICDTGNEYLIPNSNDYDYLPLH